MTTSPASVTPPTPEALAAAEAALAEERRREAALALFARRISHDMSNFVTVIRTYSELLLGDLPKESTTRADVQEIYRAAESVVEYLQRVARFSRTGGTRPGMVVIDTLLNDVLTQLPTKTTPEVGPVIASLDCPVGVQVDPTWLADAVREVLVNAREASPANANVQLRSWTELVTGTRVDGGVPISVGTWAVIEISDEGAGFASEVRDIAPDPFVTTKAGVRGAGFGLSLARGVAWNVGGHLVRDDNGSGTQVRFWLPVRA